MNPFTNFVDEVVFPYRNTGIKLRVRRARNAAYMEKLRRIMKPHKRQIDRNELPVKDIWALEDKALAGTVLVGWEGAPEEYSEQAAEDLLGTDPYLRREILDVADNAEAFIQEDQAEIEGKS